MSMRRLMIFAAMLALPSVASAAMTSLQDVQSLNRTRACLFPIGGWTIIDCSNSAAAQSAALNANSRYQVQCGDDSYFATGDEATDEADANDGWIPAGAWLEVLTSSTVRYFSCKNINADSDCRYIECQ